MIKVHKLFYDYLMSGYTKPDTNDEVDTLVQAAELIQNHMCDDMIRLNELVQNDETALVLAAYMKSEYEENVNFNDGHSMSLRENDGVNNLMLSDPLVLEMLGDIVCELGNPP